MNLETAQETLKNWSRDFLVVGYRLKELSSPSHPDIYYFQQVIIAEEDLYAVLKLFVDFRVSRLDEHKTEFYKSRLNHLLTTCQEEEELKHLQYLMAKHVSQVGDIAVVASK